MLTHHSTALLPDSNLSKIGCLKALILLLLGLASLEAEAQLSGLYQYRHYKELDGLPNELVKSVSQDTSGFLWIGTDAGLVRFDGVEYSHLNDELPSPYVKSVLCRKNGQVLATTDMGLLEIIVESDTIFPRTLLEGQGQASDSLLWYPKGMYEDRQNRVWLSDNHALFKLEKGEFHRYPMPAKTKPNHYHRSFSFFEDGYGHVFAISNTGFLFRWNAVQDIFEEVEQPSIFNEVYATYRYAPGKVYIATGSGLLKLAFDTEGNLTQQANAFPKLVNVSSIERAGEHTLLATQWIGKAILLDTDEENYSKLDDYPIRSGSCTHSSPSGIWTGSDNGIVLLRPSTFYGFYNERSPGYIQAWGEGENNRYYYSDGNAVYRVKQQQGKWESYAVRKTANDNAIISLLPTAEGVWMGGTFGKLLFMNQEGAYKQFETPAEGTVYALAQDDAGRVWFCQDGIQGVGRVSVDGEVSVLGQGQGLDMPVSGMQQLSDGKVYFTGKGDKGYIFRYDNKAKRFENLSKPIPFEKSEDLEIHQALKVGKNLWLASNFGLLRLSQDSLERMPLGKMTNSTVKSIAQDARGNLWLANSNGVVKYTPESGELFTFDEKDGLGTKVVNYRGLNADSQGRIWVSSIAGLYYGEIKEPSVTKKAKITGLQVNNESKDPRNIREVYPDDFIEVDFLSPAYPSQFMRYQYRIDDNSEWVGLGTKNSVTVGHLGQGTHTLWIKARQRGNYTWSEPTGYQIPVVSYWYTNPLSWIAAILLMGLLVRALIGLNTKRLEKEKQKLEAIIERRTYELVEQNAEIEAQREELQQNHEELQTTIENLKLTQGQLIHAEKLSSIGQLTAGIAHEINNPINFVYAGSNTLSQLLGEYGGIMRHFEALEQAASEEKGSSPKIDEALEGLKQAKEEYEYEELKEDIIGLIEDIKMGADRATEIVKNLRNFSRSDEGRFDMSDLESGIDSTLTLLNNKLHNDITIHKEYGNIPQVYCMPSQLNQVFMNIISNAIDAIDPPGEIRISTEDLNKEVVVRISDTGAGIPDEVKKHIFDPFFTTKPVGKGTGLGMSVVYSIIEKHEGRIELDSELGKGTTFSIYIPKEQRSPTEEES